jgi:hypothetical protein
MEVLARCGFPIARGYFSGCARSLLPNSLQIIHRQVRIAIWCVAGVEKTGNTGVFEGGAIAKQRVGATESPSSR